MKCNVCGASMVQPIMDWYCPNEDRHGDACIVPSGTGKLSRVSSGHWWWYSADKSVTLDIFMHKQRSYKVAVTGDFDDELRQYDSPLLATKASIREWIDKEKKDSMSDHRRKTFGVLPDKFVFKAD